MYFIANDPRVPDAIQEEMQRWGLAKDELVDNGHWPDQLYIREARRMVGSYVMTEHDVLGRNRTPQPVGMGAYTMDSHRVQRYRQRRHRRLRDRGRGAAPAGPLRGVGVPPRRLVCGSSRRARRRGQG